MEIDLDTSNFPSAACGKKMDLKSEGTVRIFTRPTQLLLMFLVIIGFTTGCAVRGLPTKEEYAAIKAGKRTVVLLRITAEVDGTQVETFEGTGHYNPYYGHIGLGLGGFDTGGKVKPIVPLFLSNKTRRKGWIYFLLEPEIHYFSVQGQRHTETYVTQPKYDQLWRIDIPDRSQVVYVGTLHLKCRSVWNIFGDKGCAFIETAVVKNQELLAAKVAGEYLKDLDSLQTHLMQRHTGTIFIRKPK